MIKHSNRKKFISLDVTNLRASRSKAALNQEIEPMITSVEGLLHTKLRTQPLHSREESKPTTVQTVLLALVEVECLSRTVRDSKESKSASVLVAKLQPNKSSMRVYKIDARRGRTTSSIMRASNSSEVTSKNSRETLRTCTEEARLSTEVQELENSTKFQKKTCNLMTSTAKISTET